MHCAARYPFANHRCILPRPLLSRKKRPARAGIVYRKLLRTNPLVGDRLKDLLHALPIVELIREDDRTKYNESANGISQT